MATFCHKESCDIPQFRSLLFKLGNAFLNRALRVAVREDGNTDFLKDDLKPLYEMLTSSVSISPEEGEVPCNLGIKLYAWRDGRYELMSQIGQDNESGTIHLAKFGDNYIIMHPFAVDPSFQPLNELRQQYQFKYVTGDGNCLLRAIIEGFGKPFANIDDEHPKLRKVLVDHMSHHGDLYEGQHFSNPLEFRDVSVSLETYISTISNSGVWLDHGVLRALSRVIRRPIWVYTDYNLTIDPVSGRFIPEEGSRYNEGKGEPIRIYLKNNHYWAMTERVFKRRSPDSSPGIKKPKVEIKNEKRARESEGTSQLKKVKKEPEHHELNRLSDRYGTEICELSPPELLSLINEKFETNDQVLSLGVFDDASVDVMLRDNLDAIQNFAGRWVFIPVLRNGHFVGIAMDKENKKIIRFNSLRDDDQMMDFEKEIIEALCYGEDYTLQTNGAITQHDKWSCGYHVVKFFEWMANGNSLADLVIPEDNLVKAIEVNIAKLRKREFRTIPKGYELLRDTYRETSEADLRDEIVKQISSLPDSMSIDQRRRLITLFTVYMRKSVDYGAFKGVSVDRFIEKLSPYKPILMQEFTRNLK